MNDKINSCALDEPRLFEDTGIEARIALLITPTLRDLHFRLVRIRLSGLNGLTLQIMTEREDGSLSIEDCEAISRALSPILDVEDIIDSKYHLEISSPGLDRPLVRRSDFQRAQNHLIKVELSTPIEGKKRFRGALKNVTDEGFTIAVELPNEEGIKNLPISFENLLSAQLILTDDLIREALAKEKALAKKASSAKAEKAPSSQKKNPGARKKSDA